jgi:hypothetical protein
MPGWWLATATTDGARTSGQMPALTDRPLEGRFPSCQLPPGTARPPAASPAVRTHAMCTPESEAQAPPPSGGVFVLAPDGPLHIPHYRVHPPAEKRHRRSRASSSLPSSNRGAYARPPSPGPGPGTHPRPPLPTGFRSSPPAWCGGVGTAATGKRTPSAAVTLPTIRPPVGPVQPR